LIKLMLSKIDPDNSSIELHHIDDDLDSGLPYLYDRNQTSRVTIQI